MIAAQIDHGADVNSKRRAVCDQKRVTCDRARASDTLADQPLQLRILEGIATLTAKDVFLVFRH